MLLFSLVVTFGVFLGVYREKYFEQMAQSYELLHLETPQNADIRIQLEKFLLNRMSVDHKNTKLNIFRIARNLNFGNYATYSKESKW